MSIQPSPERVRSTYEFIKSHRGQYNVRRMSRTLALAPIGYFLRCGAAGRLAGFAAGFDLV
jgi:hypothetical protein